MSVNPVARKGPLPDIIPRATVPNVGPGPSGKNTDTKTASDDAEESRKATELGEKETKSSANPEPQVDGKKKRMKGNLLLSQHHSPSYTKM